MKNFFDYQKEDYPYHFWLIQFIVFLYCIVRLVSRDYSIYGELPLEYFNYTRPFLSVYPSFLLEIFNTHFVYWFVDYPTSTTLYYLQKVAILLGVFGLIGFFPKICALCLFIILTHFTGFIQATNAEIEGGTLLLAVLLILAFSSSSSLYCLFKKNDTSRKNDNRWPIFFVFLVVGIFYTTSGLNKLIDVGPWWPFFLHLERLAQVSLENSLFLESRRVDAVFCLTVLNAGYLWSVIAGIITLFGELSFISILFYPKYRLLLVTNMFILHYFVYLSAGINFMGSTFILLLCLDWNSFFREATIVYNPACIQKRRFVKLAKRFDLFNKLTLIKREDSKSKDFVTQDGRSDFVVIEESNSACHGRHALAIVFHKVPLFWTLAFLSKIPFMELLAVRLCNRFNKNFYKSFLVQN